jgi:hypothetical protein
MSEMQDFGEGVSRLENKLKDQLRLVRALANFNTSNGINGDSLQEELANQRTQILRTIRKIEQDFETLSGKWHKAGETDKEIAESTPPEAPPSEKTKETERDIITKFINTAVSEDARHIWRPGDFTGSLLVFFVDGKIDSSSLLEKKIIHTKPETNENADNETDEQGHSVKVVVEPEETFSILRTPQESRVDIFFTLPEPAVVVIKVYNRLDQVVRQFEEEYEMPGDYSVEWDGLDDEGNPLPKDTYFCQLQIGSSLSELKTIVLS